MSEKEKKKMIRTERRILAPAGKELTQALEELQAPLGVQDYFERGITCIARGHGVQNKDLHVIGEFDVHVDEEGEVIREILTSTFFGFPNPNPDKEENRKLISFEEAARQKWKPAR